MGLWKKPQYDPDLNMKMPWLKAFEFVSEALALGSVPAGPREAQAMRVCGMLR